MELPPLKVFMALPLGCQAWVARVYRKHLPGTMTVRVWGRGRSTVTTSRSLVSDCRFWRRKKPPRKGEL